MGFIFGPGTEAPSYEALKKKRDIIDLIKKQALDQTPQNVPEGIAAVGKALIGRFAESKLRPQEDAEKSRIADLLAGGGLDSGMVNTMDRSPSFAPDQGDSASLIRQELVKRGLPEHVADGFVMNFKDESALNPAAVEQGGGGYGLAQWTGPRRQGLEQFAQSSGKPTSDLGTQLDYLMNELQGPESGAAAKIMGTQGAGDAAAAIAKYFERPAAGPLASRLANYTGGQSGQSEPDMGRLSQLAEVAGDPYANDGQKLVAQLLIKQMIPQPITPYQQAQLGMQGQKLAQTQDGVYGTPVYGKGPDGTWGVGAIGKDGTFHKLDTGEFTPAPTGNMNIDQGTQRTIVDRTGAPVNTLPVDLAGKAAQTAVGSNAGTIAASLGDNELRVRAATDLIDKIGTDPSLEDVTGSFEGRVPHISQGSNNVISNIDELSSKAFPAAIEALKGLGAMSDMEGQAASKALANLSRIQGTPQFKEKLQEFKDLLLSKLEIARQKAAGVPGTVEAPAPTGAKAPPPDFMLSVPSSRWTPEQQAAARAWGASQGIGQ